jgi:hypothetical protein
MRPFPWKSAPEKPVQMLPEPSDFPPSYHLRVFPASLLASILHHQTSKSVFAAPKPTRRCSPSLRLPRCKPPSQSDQVSSNTSSLSITCNPSSQPPPFLVPQPSPTKKYKVSPFLLLLQSHSRPQKTLESSNLSPKPAPGSSILTSILPPHTTTPNASFPSHSAQ